ncbi:hypothetical protein LCGC14_2714390, partial [marine sediment metagenome]
GLGDDDHTQYLLVDGSRNLTGNWSIDPGITIDGRDIRLDGQDLDTLVSNIGKVKVDTGATSDFLGAASGDGVLRTSTGISYADGGNFITLDLDINSLTGEALIVSADTIPFYDATAGANRKVTLSELSTALGGAGTDEKVGIDSGATADYIGAASGDGVLRTGSGLAYTDGGNFITVAVDINSLSVATIVSGDFVPFWDITATATNKKTTFANFEAAVNHDNLLNYAIDNHISHSAVEIQAGSGLGGGGDISLTRTIDLNINVLDVAAIAAGDFIAFWDITATAICKKITFSDFESSLSKVGSQVSVDGAAVADYIGAADSDGVLRVNGALSYVDGGDFVTLTTNDGEINHNSLLNYESDRHIAHSVVTITAGSGLSGGGNITLSRTIDLNINNLTLASIETFDLIPFWDITVTATNKKITFSDFEAALTHD